MERLSFQAYAWKCIIGAEVIYGLCVSGGYLPWRTARATELHHALLETLPGFVWGSVSNYLLGAAYVLVLALVFSTYFVWMHNSSLVKQ